MDRKLIRVDMSQLGTWRKCQLQEYFRYQVTGRGIEPIASPGPFDPYVFGNIGHHALETYEHPTTWHDKEVTLKALQAKWQEYVDGDKYKDNNRLDWANLLAQVIRAVERYFIFFDELDSEYSPVKPEVPFEIELTPDNPKYEVIFYGKIDNVVKKISNGKYYFKEYKFYAQMDENPRYLKWATQVTDYSLVGSSLFGSEFGGMDYRITRKVESPTLINFYQAILKRTREQLKTAAKLIVVQALQMQRLRELGPTFLVPVLDDHPMKVANICMGCAYNKDICSAFLEGEDWQAIQDLNYQPRALYAEHEDKKETEEEKLKESKMAF